jgi:hypothetical protein
MDRLADDILLCLFAGQIEMVDMHEHADAIHFGIDTQDTGKLASYYKILRTLAGKPSGKQTPIPWRNNPSCGRIIDNASLVNASGAGNAAQFGVTMIEGVEKVRFFS